jgi:hypothetical protein
MFQVWESRVKDDLHISQIDLHSEMTW